MGIGGFFKKTFGKQTCAFCGAEVGMMSRTKIKNDEFICNKCAHACSRHVRLGRFMKEELDGHIEYMKRQDRLYHEVLKDVQPLLIPSAVSDEAIAFYDDYGMFRIMDRDTDKQEGRTMELFRYDQVASYETYWEESEPTDKGKEKEFKEYGVKIILVSTMDNQSTLRPGTMAHPYIQDPIKVCLSKKKPTANYADNIVFHFDTIFGVRDDEKGLFSFGPTKAQKREGEAYKAMGSAFMAAIKVAKDGEGALTEEKVAELKQGMNKIDDAQTGGLAEYTRRANAAEERIR